MQLRVVAHENLRMPYHFTSAYTTILTPDPHGRHVKSGKMSQNLENESKVGITTQAADLQGVDPCRHSRRAAR